MDRDTIDKNIKRKMYAESMGRCMNPSCKKILFSKNGDIIEKAHIDPYCKTADNSFENLVILCPNCHTDFDKNSAFTPEEVKSWKTIRQKELEEFFGDKFGNFEDLKNKVLPLLLENKAIYENYYKQNNRQLWDKFEPQILINNKKIKTLLSNNFKLFQKSKNEEYSNLNYVYKYLQHIEEFENSRLDEEKNRCVLFPTEINSIFGLEPMQDSLFSLTENIEALVSKLKEQNIFIDLALGIDKPYILIKENSNPEPIYINDTARIRQMCYNYSCNNACKVRFKSLNFALKYIKNNGLNYFFVENNNFRKIKIGKTVIIFTYEYCLSKFALIDLAPKNNNIVVNLHNWNGESCISKEVHIYANNIGVEVLTSEGFYEYIKKIKNNS